jgi:hypothetical protein
VSSILSVSRPGLPDFSWHNIPNRGKYTKQQLKNYMSI